MNSKRLKQGVSNARSLKRGRNYIQSSLNKSLGLKGFSKEFI